MNAYLIQLLGLFLAIIGLVSLTIYATLFGTPLAGAERHRISGHHTGGQAFLLPLNVTTLALGLLIITGFGLLALTGFSACQFIKYWWPDAPATFLNFLCR